MHNNLNLNDAEHCAFNRAYEILGDNLADFLLSSLGESDITHQRNFTVQITPVHGSATYQFGMLNDSEQGLPTGRDPLVMAVLLGFLWERSPADGKVNLRQEEIAEQLGWSSDTEYELTIRRAIEKYASTAYYMVDTEAPEEQRLYGQYSHYRRLIINCEITRVGMAVTREVQERFTTVQFYPQFNFDINSERKFFLGINFQHLQFLKQIS
jgi:hypothetical protein